MREIIGISTDGMDLFTNVSLSFSRETQDSAPEVFKMLNEDDEQHANIVSHVMAQLIVRTKAVCNGLIDSLKKDDDYSLPQPQHILPHVVDILLFRDSPTEGEVELCRLSGSTMVQYGGDGMPGNTSYPDAGTLATLARMQLNDWSLHSDWKLLSFSCAGTTEWEKSVPGGESVKTNVIHMEVACPTRTSDDQYDDDCLFFVANYMMEVGYDEDDNLVIMDHLDNKEMEEVEEMGLSDKVFFTRGEARVTYPINLATSISSRLRSKPYESMLAGLGGNGLVTVHDTGINAMMFIGSYMADGLHGDEMHNMVPLMMGGDYSRAADELYEYISNDIEEIRSNGDTKLALWMEGISNNMMESRNAFILYEWAMCILSGHADLADQKAMKEILDVVQRVGGTKVGQ